MNTQNKSKKVILLEPGVSASREAVENIERELVFGMTRSYQFYRRMRDVVCPYSAEKNSYRSDFSVPRYNVLYRAIDAFYRRFDNVQTSTDLLQIPALVLKAQLIDWTNRNGIDDGTATTLLEEIDMEKDLTSTMTFESLSALAEGAAFADWLKSRVLDQTMGHLTSQRQMGFLTMETLEEAVLKIRSAISFSDAGANRRFDQFHPFADDDDRVLIGPGRFICREAIASITGASGIGKSTFVTQMAVCWAVGRDCFGFNPTRPLKIQIVQGENDDGDIAAMFSGVINGLNLSAEELKLLKENLLCMRSNGLAGADFIQKIVRTLVETNKPDLVILDPILAFLGADFKSQEHVGNFLRINLMPLLQRAQSACLIVHHTNKPPSLHNRALTNNTEAYAEAGSAEFRNVVRAAIAVTPIGSRAYELSVPKRGTNLNWSDADGHQTTKKTIRHSLERGMLFWELATPDEVEAIQKAAKKNAGDQLETKLLRCLRTGTEIADKQLFEMAQSKGIGRIKYKETVTQLIEKGHVTRHERPRRGTKSEIVYLRVMKLGIQGGEVSGE